MIPFNTILGLLFFAMAAPSFATNINFDGQLIEDACDIFPGDENIEIDFGTVVNQYLYTYTRTKGIPFKIRLINCDLELSKSVTIKFSGTESSISPGLIALTPSSSARGIALGIESQSGDLIPINKGSHTNRILTRNNSLALQAFIQIDPEALSNKSLLLGDFIATATFELDYN
ncbi:fimbrial protein [Providencia vermicola]|uniref:fimbrial protein n=1 Tax=Providencia vermicola TaxID=333965 RepID=UPI0034DD6D98